MGCSERREKHGGGKYRDVSSKVVKIRMWMEQERYEGRNVEGFTLVDEKESNREMWR